MESLMRMGNERSMVGVTTKEIEDNFGIVAPDGGEEIEETTWGKTLKTTDKRKDIALNEHVNILQKPNLGISKDEARRTQGKEDPQTAIPCRSWIEPQGTVS